MSKHKPSRKHKPTEPTLLLRADAPERHARFWARRDKLQAALGVGGLLGLVATFLLYGAFSAGDGLGIALNTGLIVAVVAFCGWLAHRIEQAEKHTVGVHTGEHYVRHAHAVYAKLSSDDAREHAMPLLETMYRLAGVQAHSDGVRDELHDRLRDRLDALNRLLDAEERLHLATDSRRLDDDTDLDAARQWRDALADVEAQVRADDPDAR